MRFNSYRLGDICKRLSSGKSITAESIKDEGDYPVFGANGLRGYTDSYNFDGSCAVIGRQGAYCGNVKYVEGQIYMSEHAVVAQADENNNSKYLAYKLGILKLGRFSGQAAQPGLSVHRLARLLIEMPDKSLQEKIAGILSKYDEAIENNNKRIKLLDQMAQNLYKEWFVRFRFPGWQNAEFENGIPKGWKVEKVGAFCKIFTGKKDVNQTVENGKYAFFSCAPEVFHSNDYLYDGKAILVAGNGSYTGRTRFYEGKFDLYQRTYAITTDAKDFIEYLYWTFKIDFEAKYSGGTRGAAIPYIVLRDIANYKFFYEPVIVKKFIDFIIPINNQINKLNAKTQNLSRQRDLLLPRLMSGKLQVFRK